MLNKENTCLVFRKGFIYVCADVCDGVTGVGGGGVGGGGEYL